MTQSATAPDMLTVRVRVSQLLDEFFTRLDRAESVADLLTADAEFRDAKGRDAVAELFLSLARKREDLGRTSRHLSSNVTIEELGGGRYRVRSLVVVLSLDTQPEPRGDLLAADHEDIVVIDADGACRFAKRIGKPVLKLGGLSAL
ncbi:MAG: hypothetical protein QOG76_3258 [Pseudonocardiales bacterium]|jgi:hypothetical protein|nr:hypothetical protein [Pseudonocardiales bacterium]MDT7625740.1 hypothetical protein [Pseudonocardiales bacterium]